MITFVA